MKTDEIIDKIRDEIIEKISKKVKEKFQDINIEVSYKKYIIPQVERGYDIQMDFVFKNKLSHYRNILIYYYVNSPDVIHIKSDGFRARRTINKNNKIRSLDSFIEKIVEDIIKTISYRKKIIDLENKIYEGFIKKYNIVPTSVMIFDPQCCTGSVEKRFFKHGVDCYFSIKLDDDDIKIDNLTLTLSNNPITKDMIQEIIRFVSVLEMFA